VQNTGTVHFDSQATVAIKNLIGGPINVDLGTHTVLPNSIRAFEAQWTKNYPFGYYKLTATALDGDKKPITTTSWMIAIPLVIVIPILLVIISIILIIKYIRSRFKIITK